MPKSSHRPIRTCLGCGQRDLKSAMVRIAACGDHVALDPKGRLQGRGGYLHGNAECARKFETSKIKRFRSLKLTVSPEAREKITQRIRTRLDSEVALA